MKKTHLFILLSLIACRVINGPVVAMERSGIEIQKKYDNLYKAIKDNDVKSVYRIILDDNDNISAKSLIKDLNGATPLHYAVILGRKEIIQIFLNNGANPNIKDNNGGTPLHYAAIVGIKKIDRFFSLFYDNKTMVQILLDNGANPNIEDNYRNIPRDYAEKYNHDMIVKLFDQKVFLESQEILDEICSKEIHTEETSDGWITINKN